MFGNTDRHGDNFLVDHGNIIHPIDHNISLRYFNDKDWESLAPLFKRTPEGGILTPFSKMRANFLAVNPNSPIPEDFRQKVLSTPDEHFHSLMDTYMNHPNAQGYFQKIYQETPHEEVKKALKNHLSERLGLLRRLYGDSRVANFGHVLPYMYDKEAHLQRREKAV